MAINNRKKQKTEELIVTSENLKDFRDLLKRIGGIKNFDEAMAVFEAKGPHEKVEDIVPFGYLSKLFNYDNDGNLYSAHTGKKVGQRKNIKNYLFVEFRFENYRFKTPVHKIVFALANGRWSKKNHIIDHINGITDDNRPSNLREATYSENSCNTRTKVNNKLASKKTKCIREFEKYFIVSIMKNGKKYYNYFPKSSTIPDEVVFAEAKAWRNQKSKELHGEFYREY